MLCFGSNASRSRSSEFSNLNESRSSERYADRSAAYAINASPCAPVQEEGSVGLRQLLRNRLEFNSCNIQSFHEKRPPRLFFYRQDWRLELFLSPLVPAEHYTRDNPQQSPYRTDRDDGNHYRIVQSTSCGISSRLDGRRWRWREEHVCVH